VVVAAARARCATVSAHARPLRREENSDYNNRYDGRGHRINRKYVQYSNRTSTSSEINAAASTRDASSPATAIRPVRSLCEDIAQLRIVLVLVHVVHSDMPCIVSQSHTKQQETN
jgi:hypothetical protein